MEVDALVSKRARLTNRLIDSTARLLADAQDHVVRGGQGPGRDQRAHAAEERRPAAAALDGRRAGAVAVRVRVAAHRRRRRRRRAQRERERQQQRQQQRRREPHEARRPLGRQRRPLLRRRDAQHLRSTRRRQPRLHHRAAVIPQQPSSSSQCPRPRAKPNRFLLTRNYRSLTGNQATRRRPAAGQQRTSHALLLI